MIVCLVAIALLISNFTVISRLYDSVAISCDSGSGGNNGSLNSQ